MKKEKKEKLKRKNRVLPEKEYDEPVKKEEFLMEEEIEILDESNPLPIKKSPLKLAKHKKKKKKLKKWVYLIVFLISAIIVGLVVYLLINNANKKRLEEGKRINEERLAEIQSHYNNVVKVNDKSNLYVRNNDNYEIIGYVYKDNVFELGETTIDIDTKYFNIKDSDYYIEYQYVDKVEKQEEYSSRYKKYLPFNKNVVTKDGFTLYDDDKEVISFNKGMEFPIIINNYENKYYVEYNNRLLSIKKDDVKEIIDKKNTDKKNRKYITTLAYHRVYDTNEKCNDGYICLKKASFDKQMKYLSDNNYLTLTMDEMYMYLKGYLQVEKAVTITFDDGYLYKSAEDVLKKYNLNGTMFVISGDFKDLTQFDNLEIIDVQSHTHKMHKNYVCSGGNQGGAMLCAGKTKIMDDLKKSLEALNIKPVAFAYPFYDYNDTAISALKELGFKLAFIGRAGVLGKAYPKSTNLYKIPRMTVWEESLMSFNEWKGYL